MDIRYTRSLNRNYINFLPDREPAPDSYEMHMLLSGEAECLLPCLLTKFDGCTFLSFDISSCKPVSSLSDRGPLRADFLRRFLASLSDALRSLTDCLLDMTRVPLHPEYIYFREDPFTLKLCYLPEGAENPWQNLHTVMQFFLEHLDPSDPEALLMTYRLYRRSSDPAASPEMLLQESKADFSVPDAAGEYSSKTASKTFSEEDPTEKDHLEEDGQGSILFSETYIPYGENTDSSPADPFPVNPFPADSALTGTCLADSSLTDSFLRDPLLTDPSCDPKNTRKKFRTVSAVRRTAALVLFVICAVITASLAFFSLTTAFPSRAVPAAACVFGVLSIFFGTAGLVCGRSQGKIKRQGAVRPDAVLQKRPDFFPAEDPKKRPAPFSASVSQDREKPLREPAPVSGFSVSGASDTERKGTTVLGASPAIRAMLVPAPGFWQPAVCLPEQTVILGTQPGKYGIVIRDDTVSRMHAKIHIGEDGYFLEDLNSTNGTFLNEKAVLGREKKKLRDGDRVRFAALEYIFCYK